MFVISVHNFKMLEQIRLSAEYNQRAAIIKGLRARRLQTEIILFLGYSRSIVYDVAAKYLASKTSEKGSANQMRKNHLKEKSVKIPTIIKGSRTCFRGSRVVSDKISKNLGCE